MSSEGHDDYETWFPREPHHSQQASMVGDIEWFDDLRPALTSPYVIKGLLDIGAMSVLYGPSNSGKTFFAADLAFHVAASREWRERRTSGGSVLYLAAEGGNGIANRMVALKQSSGATGVPLAIRRAGLDLLHPEADVPRLIELAEHLGQRTSLRLIVIDTLSRVLAGGDENGPVDMTAFVKNIDVLRHSTGAHVMVVHHTGKDVARGARGHNSLRAATDTEIEIMVDELDHRVAKVTKQRDHAGGETFHFELESVLLGEDQDRDPVTSCVVRASSSPPAEDGTPPLQTCRAMLDLIAQGWATKNPLSTAPQSQKTGRYAPRFLSQHFALRQGDVQRLLGSWLDNEIITMDTVDPKTKRRGLRVLQRL